MIESSNHVSFQSFSQPLVPRENVTAWMNAIGLVITALPVRRTVIKDHHNE